ncbi:hypothetical protein AB0E62_17125 [Streptomyces sp. NPDC038707]|uniref:hypothetical protein n=1 Tax=Streptomyces sp. NPDC038707 TaxID=3154329 RepID=UPI0033D02A0C
MSDDWKHKPEYKSAAQQVDKEVGQQVKPITTAQNVLAHMPLFGGVRVNLVGSTNFEGHKLNDMIDLVEHANPEHLELTSKSLFDAGKDIRKAASDLEQHLRVDWEGEGAEAFHAYTQKLIHYTNSLAGYADAAGTHLSVAATGLASARISMPPRDTRPAAEQKLPTELPKAKQVESDPDYAAALKVEKNRQEAINQMNRLASYYKVAATDLSKAKEPEPIEPIPTLGVPKAFADDVKRGYGSDSTSSASTPTAAVRGDAGDGHAAAATSHGTTAHGTTAHGHVTVPPLKEVHEPGAPSGHDVGTEINTTTTLPPQAPTTPSPTTPTPTLPTTSGGGPLPPLPTGPMAPPVTPTGRTPGYGPGGRPPVTAQGRTGPTGTGTGRVPQGPTGEPGRAVSTGRVPQGPMGQAGRSVPGSRVPQGPVGQAARAMGRTTPPGQPAARGPVQSGHAPTGRPVTGGMPRTTGASGGRTGATGPTGSARNGVVGGKPVTGRTSGSTPNPRVPRGMVVGAEEPSSATPQKGAIGQRGVFGAPRMQPETGASQAVLRSAGNPEGAIGVPRGAAKGSESSGSGLGRGAVGGRQGSDGESGRTGGTAEKEQRRSSQQRRDVPKTSD